MINSEQKENLLQILSFFVKLREIIQNTQGTQSYQKNKKCSLLPGEHYYVYNKTL